MVNPLSQFNPVTFLYQFQDRTWISIFLGHLYVREYEVKVIERIIDIWLVGLLVYGV